VYRTKPSEHKNSGDPDATGDPLGSILKVAPDALSIHPQHSQQMKLHQVEGFNFLVKNLADESDPGGCILAHAPGSGKTFLLISFIHSFLARYPAGRPLIMLPKSVLGNWKTEFLCWQVEDIPLYDFYSSKANNRSEQLKVLKLWEENRSILLLGYQQFAHIISDDSFESDAIVCKEKLMKVPSLLILDEGHTSRNDQTDLLNALETIKTPRKVVLSGTLFQNHVSEVFNILNLVRPKFLKMQKSRAIVKRILAKVDMFGKSARSRNISEKVFYDLIEENFQKDSNDKIRVMIIQNLRELTENVLHYYQGEILKDLPGLVDFTVLLNLSAKQDNIIKGLVPPQQPQQPSLLFPSKLG
jgi:DNA repair and recombination protein RAD54 and RAD54-like protein